MRTLHAAEIKNNFDGKHTIVTCVEKGGLKILQNNQVFTEALFFIFTNFKAFVFFCLSFYFLVT